MERLITIEGVAKTIEKPDFIIVKLLVEGEAKKYADAVNVANAKTISITQKIIETGFKKELIKTTQYKVNPQYKASTDRKGKYQREFTGYMCNHSLVLEFDYDAKLLGDVLTKITESCTNPQLNISFTIKDKESLGDKLLEIATKNAKKRAEIMCKASGANLGKLVKIDYNWNGIDVFSKPRYDMNNTCEIALPTAIIKDCICEPDDIELTDSATFIWEIE